MKRDFARVISDLKEGKGPSLLLLFGEDLQVQEACKSIVDLLVPESQRDFNLERFDGRTTSWDRLEASLLTPPFFPGKKVLWVENIPYFYSREQKGELGERILQLWNDGKKDEASKLLGDLLIMEGWTQERWDRIESSSAGALLELLGVDRPEARSEVEALVAYGQNRGMNLGAASGAEGERLAAWLDRGLPDWTFILLTAVQVDRRMRLYKRFEEAGAALHLDIERDRSGRASRESMLDFITRRLGAAGKILDAQAREAILLRAGADLRGLSQELEKLILYVGDRKAVRGEDVKAIFTDQSGGWIFDLTKSIGERDAVAALARLGRLIAQGEAPLKLLGMIASEVRRLLAARQLLENELRGCWRRGMSYSQFQQSVLKQGAPLLTRNPYGDYLCFQRAERFSMGALCHYLHGIYEADFRLKSSGGSARLAMERLILQMCLQS